MAHNAELDLTAPWLVHTASDAPPIQLAVRELQQHWRKMTGQSLLVSPTASAAQVIRLAVNDQGTDGFAWQATPTAITIEGHSARGLLYGVYALLEALGCRWLAPGALWTQIPQQQTVAIPAAVSEAPAFAGRCLIIGHYAFMLESAAWIAWAARNRYNTIFFHTAPNDIGGGSVPEWAWQRYREQALALLHERDMTIEIGGHGLPALLPRALFKTMPAAFRLEKGKRTKRHNFCPSSPQAKEVVQQNARRYFIEHPGFAVYHIWADDIPGGGWCSCEQCAGLSSSDQLLLATNTVAEVLAEVEPQAELSFIAYLDTEAPPTQIRPRPNVCLLWAPRTRNYGKAIDDPACPVNTPRYPALLQQQIDHFAEGGTVRVFEYYSDAILFKSVLPVMNKVLQQDLRAYHAAGVHTVQTLMTGDRPWLSAQLTNWLFGRLTWQPDTDLDALVADFCRAAFGPGWQPMTRYYATLDAAFALVLNQTPDQRRAVGALPSPLALLREPMADMEDPVHAAAATLQKRAGDAVRVLELVDEAADSYLRAQTLDGGERIAQEGIEFSLTRVWLTFGAARLQLYAALANGAPRSAIKDAWSAAAAAYREVLLWARVHLDPPFRQNMQLLHMAMWGLRLRRIQADQLTPWVGRWWVDLGTLWRLVGRGFQTYRLYKQAKRG